LDGFETTQRLRAMPNFERLPIIAASASVFDHHQQASKEVGCDDFIAIPFHTHDLLALLQKQLNLTWIYKQDEAVTANTDDPEAIVYPSLEQMKTLLELAMQGDIAGIIEQIDALKEENAKLAPFLNKIRQLAKSFKEEEICELLEECLKTK
jgi:CheY-like chemotaxis protein